MQIDLIIKSGWLTILIGIGIVLTSLFISFLQTKETANQYLEKSKLVKIGICIVLIGCLSGAIETLYTGQLIFKGLVIATGRIALVSGIFWIIATFAAAIYLLHEAFSPKK